MSSPFSASSSFSLFFFFLRLLLAWCLVFNVWVVRKRGKAKEIYIYFLILVCFLIIYMILSFYLFAWCLGAEKMWESKEKWAFIFLISDLFGSKKLEATENGPNRTD